MRTSQEGLPMWDATGLEGESDQRRRTCGVAKDPERDKDSPRSRRIRGVKGHETPQKR